MIVRLAFRVLAVAIASTPAAAFAQDAQTRATAPVAPTSEAPSRPWQVGDAAPSVEGIHLGDSEAQVIAVLGAPGSPPAGVGNAPSALRTLRYRDGGLLIGIGTTGSVARIMLSKPDAGSVAGIKVGDRLGHLVRLWGEPTAGGGSTGQWPMGEWSMSVRGDMVSNVVMRITLVRTPPAMAQPPATVAAPAP